MRWISVLTMVSCDLLDPKDTTGDTAVEVLPFESRIQVFCSNADCSAVGLYGGASGDDVVSYEWLVDDVSVSSSDEIAVNLLEFGQFIDVKLIVEDSGGNTSTSGMQVAPLNFTIAKDGTLDKNDIQASIAMPTGITCDNPIGMASIGGCLRLSDILMYNATDLNANGSVGKNRPGGPVVYDSGIGELVDTATGQPLPQTTFAEGVAWYQRNFHGNANSSVQFLDMIRTDYSLLGGRFTPIARDPIVANIQGINKPPENHMTFWFQPVSTGTQILASHIDLPDPNEPGLPVFHDKKIVVNCDGNQWQFGLEDVTESDLSFEPFTFGN